MFIDEENFELIKKQLKDLFNLKDSNTNGNNLEIYLEMKPKGKPIDFAFLKKIKKKKDYFQPVSSLNSNEIVKANNIKTLDLFYNKLYLFKDKN